MWYSPLYSYWRGNPYDKLIEISELEIVVVLGPKALEGVSNESLEA
jgi:hypothetical protein